MRVLSGLVRVGWVADEASADEVGTDETSFGFGGTGKTLGHKVREGSSAGHAVRCVFRKVAWEFCSGFGREVFDCCFVSFCCSSDSGNPMPTYLNLMVTLGFAKSGSESACPCVLLPATAFMGWEQ